MIVSTPCIGLCKIDQTSRLCMGCYRSIEEITRWGHLSESERLALMKQLPTREKLLTQTTKREPSQEVL
jgi:predicted Fe-S protein YdhL (DUF1289 family)